MKDHSKLEPAPGKPSRPVWPLLMIAAGFILLLIIAIVFLQQSQTGQLSANQNLPTGSVRLSEADIQRVSPADAKTALDDGQAVFIDVRDSQSYADGHIPGARLSPVNDISQHMRELDKNQWIITYCT